VGNIRGSVGRVRAGGGDGGGWSDSLCTKRITFISGKPRVAPNCNQFFVFLFFSRTHRSPSASLSPPPILSAVHSVPFLLVPFRTDPCLRRAGPCFVRSLARSLARSFVRSFVRSRDSRYHRRCRRRRRCQTAGTNINTNSRVHGPLCTP